MKYCKLRTAWSAGWGILCLLLIALWVRSYRVGAYASTPVGSKTLYVVAEDGEVEALLFQFVLSGHGMGLRTPKVSNSVSIAEALGFEIVYVANFYSGVTIPFWFGCAVCGGMAAVSCAKGSWRFSLRTLLIGMTLVAALLGAVVWAAN